MNLGLSGKRCIITGASRGIGAAIAKALANEGAKLALIARGREDLETLAKSISSESKVDVVFFGTDLSSPFELGRSMTDAIEKLGGVDVLINNAGSSAFGSFDTISDQDWEDAFNLKLMGYVRGMRSVLPYMRSQCSGRIINIIGMAGRFSSSNYSLGCFNAALLHLTKSMGDYLAPDGVAVLAVNPGFTGTDRILRAMEIWAKEMKVSKEEFSESYLREVPLGRLVDPAEVGKVVTFLCSDIANAMSGSSVQVDGGASKGSF